MKEFNIPICRFKVLMLDNIIRLSEKNADKLALKIFDGDIIKCNTNSDNGHYNSHGSIICEVKEKIDILDNKKVYSFTAIEVEYYRKKK